MPQQPAARGDGGMDHEVAGRRVVRGQGGLSNAHIVFPVHHHRAGRTPPGRSRPGSGRREHTVPHTRTSTPVSPRALIGSITPIPLAPPVLRCPLRAGNRHGPCGGCRSCGRAQPGEGPPQQVPVHSRPAGTGQGDSMVRWRPRQQRGRSKRRSGWSRHCCSRCAPIYKAQARSPRRGRPCHLTNGSRGRTRRDEATIATSGGTPDALPLPCLPSHLANTEVRSVVTNGAVAHFCPGFDAPSRMTKAPLRLRRRAVLRPLQLLISARVICQFQPGDQRGHERSIP